MAEKRITYKVQDAGGIGEVHVAEEVVTTIIALAATETEGVASLAGNITHERAGKVGVKNLAKGVKMSIRDNIVNVDLNINVEFDKNILETSKKVQEKVKSAVENMTGLEVADINIHISSVDLDNEKDK